MTIKRLLKFFTIGTVSALVLILGLTFVAGNIAKTWTKRLISQDQVRLLALSDLYSQGLQMGQATRNFLLKSDDASARANYGKAREAFSKALDVATATARGPYVEEMKRIGLLSQEDQGLQQQLWSLVESGKGDEATAFLIEKETPKWREMKEVILSSISSQKKEMGKALEEQESRSFRLMLMVTLVAFIAIVGSLAVGAFINRKIGRRLAALSSDFDAIAQGNLNVSIKDAGSDEIGILAKSANAMAGTLSATVNSVLSNARVLSEVSGDLKNNSEKAALGAREQSARATQIATAAEEMSQTITHIAQSTASARQTTDVAAQAAEEGRATAEQTVLHVKAIASASVELSGMISGLNTQVAGIGSFVEIINDIADQTNLLALNAAIEAARAGEAGRGFAVVADEVKKLAERTIGATREISSMIESIRAESGRTSESMENASHIVEGTLESIEVLSSSLEHAVTNARNAQGEIMQIATAVEQQATTSEEIASGVGDTSAAAHEIRVVSGDVMVQARSVAAIADELKGMVVQHDAGDDVLKFDIARIRHLIFLEKINQSVQGVIELLPEALPDHHQCDFGKWYYSEGMERCGSMQGFRGLEETHARIHALAKEAVGAANEGNKGKAQATCGELEKLSKTLITALGTVKQECNHKSA